MTQTTTKVPWITMQHQEPFNTYQVQNQTTTLWKKTTVLHKRVYIVGEKKKLSKNYFFIFLSLFKILIGMLGEVSG